MTPPHTTLPARRAARWKQAWPIACLAVLLGLAGPVRAAGAVSFDGPCDASAAVALDAEHFVVGNDETNDLWIYRRGTASAVTLVPLAAFLGLGARDEADIEGAAPLGDRVYWITSHARDSKGRTQAGRHRLFATEIVPGAPPTVRPSGRPYRDLLADLLAAPALAAYPLAAAAGRAAEAEGGFNIEGLAATPDGRLLIGLRNPVPRGRALLISLDNPDDVVTRGQRARIGGAIELDLGGRGIRSIERVGDAYFIAAGPPGNSGSFAIYRWSGRAEDAPSPVAGFALGDMRPEALFARPGSDMLMLLSDDGGLRVAGTQCKQRPMDRQAFRGLEFLP